MVYGNLQEMIRILDNIRNNSEDVVKPIDIVEDDSKIVILDTVRNNSSNKREE